MRGGGQANWKIVIAVTTVVAAAAAMLVVGLVIYVSARADHDRALRTLSATRSYAGRVHQRLEGARTQRVALRSSIALATRTRNRLIAQRDAGFAMAMAVGWARGTRAGGVAGEREGRRDGRAQRSHVAASGWYFAHVSWRDGLPTIDDSYRIRAGGDRAYWISNGQAYQRDTTSG
jgi:hypothetical protein